MKRTLKGATRAAVGATATVGAILLPFAEVASANTVQILGNNAHPIIGITNYNGVDSGTVDVTTMQNQESYNPYEPWSLVCNTQGFVAEYIYGAWQFQTYSSYNGGCAFSRGYGYPNLIGYTGRGSVVRHKWKSDATNGNWTTIGDIPLN